MAQKTWLVALLLFCSGLCSLVYQTVWMREFRLVFGASTSATAAVLAIFMGGLGIGSALFGKRADSAARPLAMYARFEFVIAVSAVLSLPILWIVRQAYLATGGSVQLGLFSATVVRLSLAAIVLAIPTLAMGGTLPAAARAAETDADTARRNLALLYGMNTLGAVAGTLVSTFFMLERFGNRRTLIIAALLNLLVAVVANGFSRRWNEAAIAHTEIAPARDDVETPAPLPILIVAGVAGFAFLLMELVWYRMLGPLLGGTTFTFGLILAVALLGIGAGGLAYGLWNRATVRGLAITTALEALAVAIPFALGDRLAILANILRRLGDLGFGGFILGWFVITFLTVFPAAFVSGIQFPMLIALLGRGKENVGKHVGLAYAWNTAGAITGSIAGGFGLLPLLTAPGAWKAVTVMLAGLAIAIPLMAQRPPVFAKRSIAIGVLAILCLFATGPTAVWRHSSIGAGRFETPASINGYRETINTLRRRVIWDADGRESSVALMGGDDLVMMLNGKSDGSATGDAGTQVMGGMIGGLLHGAPRRALVVGLGTGTTAGWLAKIPGMNRVDVVELEPVAFRIAEACAAVNQDVLHLANVKSNIADAREVLLATKNRYDIIFSEPSNPYRAGIASLFTTEFYEAAAKKLSDDGIFLQWTQAYDIDAATLRTIYGTITGVFPNVQTYWTTYGDLILVATKRPLVYDVDQLRKLIAAEPHRSALYNTWRVTTLEGFLSHMVGNEKMATLLASQADTKNTDDRTTIEFSFARAVNARDAFVTNPLVALGKDRGFDRPQTRGNVDWGAVEVNRDTTSFPGASERRSFARTREAGDLRTAAVLWNNGRWSPANLNELSFAGEALAESGDARAVNYAGVLSRFSPAEADAIMARLLLRQNNPSGATEHLIRAFEFYRKNPWPKRDTMRRALETAMTIAAVSRPDALKLYAALEPPFAARQLDYSRLLARVSIISIVEQCSSRTVAALKVFEPHVPWTRDHLELRARCYAQSELGSLAERAEAELRRFEAAEPEALTH